VARTESIDTIMGGTNVLIIKIRSDKKKADRRTITTCYHDNSRMGRLTRKSFLY
jgi:hypothetical protein